MRKKCAEVHNVSQRYYLLGDTPEESRYRKLDLVLVKLDEIHDIILLTLLMELVENLVADVESAVDNERINHVQLPGYRDFKKLEVRWENFDKFLSLAKGWEDKLLPRYESLSERYHELKGLYAESRV